MTADQLFDKLWPECKAWIVDLWCIRHKAPSDLGLLMDQQEARLRKLCHRIAEISTESPQAAQASPNGANGTTKPASVPAKPVGPANGQGRKP